MPAGLAEPGRSKTPRVLLRPGRAKQCSRARLFFPRLSTEAEPCLIHDYTVTPDLETVYICLK
jgi:hypothetical protein